MNKLAEKIVGAPVTTWVSLKNYQQYTAVARCGTASPLDDVTIQLRKATDASGANATNIGSAVTAKTHAEASLRAEDLGDFSATVPYAFVSASVSDEASPNTVTSYAVLSDARYPALDYDLTV